ncbi:MAK10-like protein [Tanacetum coccineum]
MGESYYLIPCSILSTRKCEIDRATDGKLRNKNADESWEIIENLALYDHEDWNDTKEFVKPVKAISMPQGISKTPDRRLLELEDQINFLQKRSRPTLRSSTHIPHAYTDAVYSNPRLHEHNKPPKLNSFAFRKRTGPSPQPQSLGTTFEARVRDYMAVHTKRMERFKNAIFKQREEINARMTKMFGLLKELTTNKTLEKVLIRNKAKVPVTKNVNSISLARGEEEGSDKTDETLDNMVKPIITEMELPMKEAKRSNETKFKPVKRAKKKEVEELLSSRPVEYYLKNRINEKLIKGLVDNNRFNDSLSRAWKKDIGGNFEIPWSIRGLKHVNALVDQGSDVNVMPYSTYMKLTDERLAETNIRLSLASHLYIYPLGIAEDVLVEVAEHVYPVYFVILDIKENEKRPFILGTPYLTTAKTTIKFDKGTITLRSGKKLVLEWEEKIKLHLEREMMFNQWRSKCFKGKHPTLIAIKEEMDDEGEVTTAMATDKGAIKCLIRTATGIHESCHTADHPGEDSSLLGGILRRLEAFVASPIGCGGSDVGIA